MADPAEEVAEVDEAMAAANGSTVRLAAGLSGLVAKAVQAATGFDASANRFRQANGQFASTSSVAGAAFGAAMTGVGKAAHAAAGAISAVGDMAVSALTGKVPTATQAMSALDDVMGGAITSSAGAAAGALSKLGPEGAAAGAALEGAAAIMSATVGTMTTLMGVAIDVSQTLGIMTDRFAALAGGAAGGKAVQDMIGHLNLPFATAEVNTWAQSLLGAGVKGKQLEEDIKAVAAATALMGESGGAAALSLFKRLGEGGPAANKLTHEIQTGGRRADKILKEMGLSVADLGGQAAIAKMNAEQLHDAIAKAMAKKGAGPLADMAMTFPAILQKAQEGLRSLFGGLGPAIKPFMVAVKALFGEFNKGSPTIKKLTPIVTAVFSTLFGWATKAANVIRDVVKAFSGTGKPGMITTLVNGFKAIFGNAMVLKGVVVIFKLIAGVIGFVVAVVGALIAVAAVAAAGFSSMVGEIATMISGIADIGGQIVDGLTSGLDPGAFIAKMADMASAGLASFKSILGIASPSKVMLEHGKDDIAGAAATGVDQGGAKMDAAMSDLGAPPKGGGNGGASKGRGKGGGDVYNFYYTGPADEAESFFEKAQQWLQTLRDEAPSP